MNYLEADEAIRYEDEKFTECRAVKIYFVYRDRNAWYETRSTKYYNGCISPSFESAAQVAEKMRVRGSAIYIEEIPAIQFLNKKLSLVVTEINSAQPLQYLYDLSDITEITLLDVYQYFSPANQNSIIRLIRLRRNSRNSFVALQPSNGFKQYKSSPKGSNYLLGWIENDHKISSSSVILLAAGFDEIITSENKLAFQVGSPELALKHQSLIEELELSVRSAYSLKSAGIRFIGDLVQYTEFMLKREIDSDKCINEIRNVLADIGLGLKTVSHRIEDKPIDELELSVRTGNALKNAKISTIGDLIKLSESDLLKKQNFGRKSLSELKDVICDFGLQLQPNNGN